MALTEDSQWLHMFKDIVNRDLFYSLFRIDEAHTIEQSGLSFLTEFVSVVETIAVLSNVQAIY